MSGRAARSGRDDRDEMTQSPARPALADDGRLSSWVGSFLRSRLFLVCTIGLLLYVLVSQPGSASTSLTGGLESAYIIHQQPDAQHGLEQSDMATAGQQSPTSQVHAGTAAPTPTVTVPPTSHSASASASAASLSVTPASISATAASQTGTVAPTPAATVAASETAIMPSPAPINNPQQAYRRTQFLPTPFPDAYESQLYRAARQLGVTVPDVFSRHRREGGAFGVCPPHDMDGEGRRNARIEIARVAGGAYNATSMDPPALQSLARITVGLVLVSYNAPESLAATLKSWAEGGLLDLVDDKLAFLNAPLQVEIDMCVAHGFRVYTPHAEEVKPILRRHDGWLSRFRPSPQLEAFPPTRFHKGDTTRPATYVAPAQLLAYLDMSTDLILFAEKDYALPEAQNTEQLVRSLLASVAMLQANTAVVRLRRTDDPNREALQNCCNGECGGSFNNFGEGCVWSAHLNWLSLFCDMEGIEDRSRGALKACMDERAQSAKGKVMLDFLREQKLEGVAAAPADGRYTLPVELHPDGSPSSAWRRPPAAPSIGGEGSNDTHTLAGGNATSKDARRRLYVPGPVLGVDPNASSHNASSGDNSTATSSAANSAASGSAGKRKYAWVEPMRTFCFSLEHSNWSNNVAMFGRRWWIEALGHGAVLTEGDNGSFEVNMIGLCSYTKKHGLGGGANGDEYAGICQLDPGIFYHKEYDGFELGRRRLRAA